MSLRAREWVLDLVTSAYNGDMFWRCIFTEAFEEAERAWAAEKALEREREDNEAVEEGPLSLSATSSTEVESI